jgi:hypothetical protein
LPSPSLRLSPKSLAVTSCKQNALTRTFERIQHLHPVTQPRRARHLWSSQSCSCNGAKAPERPRSAERRGLSRPPAQDATDGGRADRGKSSDSYRLSRWLNALRFPKEICVNVYARTKQMCLLKGPSPNDLLSDVQKILTRKSLNNRHRLLSGACLSLPWSGACLCRRSRSPHCLARDQQGALARLARVRASESDSYPP